MQADSEPKDMQKHILNVMSDGQIRLAVVGNVDAGKSTLIGTLCHSKLDDGNGSNRLLVSKFKHEIESGRTSTITTHLMAFEESGKTLVPPKSVGRYAESYVASHAYDRTAAFIDLAGHERYFKTTIQGLSRGMADFALVLVNASQSLTYMTIHHLSLCHMCGMPVIVVITKIDAAPPDVLQHTRKKISEALRSPEIGKKPYAVRNEADIETVADKTHALAPMFEISCVTGENLDLLRKLIHVLPKRRLHSKKMDRPFEFLIEEVFEGVTGVGTVLSGFVNAGCASKGETVYIGPLKDGTYMKTVAKSIHVAQTLVDEVWSGHAACIAVSLSKTQRRMLSRKGMIMQKEPITPAAVGFTAEICLARGDSVTMVAQQTQTTMHILHLKQTCRLEEFEVIDLRGTVEPPITTGVEQKRQLKPATVLRPGQRARAKFSFLQGPQYVRQGMRVILREGLVRGIGIIKDVEIRTSTEEV
mmetsp:Transcript_1273/g.1687  ORF Transcript_1273/g.1687 Transcript_1273/m.1687 type:complete len:474 (-) Transcript_1273:336-1757(-)|eukprot:CAMPEP_0198150288 /NCGR_PEP_ID=MMETSP1443-20131203/50210_1 /TAXON_ID=186043 /ORGANISM="Entomoneis sp., Strain CCMP2396" /LENGTH=473 /DNA_ID=CAMNT_0043815553 /DNA_START=76 /DNA_END=1497 /DNA_ORIENTATION=-